MHCKVGRTYMMSDSQIQIDSLSRQRPRCKLSLACEVSNIDAILLIRSPANMYCSSTSCAFPIATSQGEGLRMRMRFSHIVISLYIYIFAHYPDSSQFGNLSSSDTKRKARLQFGIRIILISIDRRLCIA